MSDLVELLDHYFSLGVSEGKEGRDHDTPTGEAQATRDLIDIKISKAATEIEGLRWENQELRADCQRKDELLTAAVDDYNDARSLAIEECAKVAERDADWSAFGKAGFEPWENGPDSVRDYRIGISSGRAIAASIRALTMSDIHREQ